MARMLAPASMVFKIGGELEISRLGYGAMRSTGRGFWGPPADREDAMRTLRRLPELGVDLIDTADAYGPFISEDLIREALHIRTTASSSQRRSGTSAGERTTSTRGRSSAVRSTSARPR
jgi:pyridoxine 4-dehydrogenase